MKSPYGSRHQRRLKRYSENFERIFLFFLKSYRSGILTFCGSDVTVEFDPEGPNGKEGFRLYDDGFFKNKEIYSSQPRILESVIRGKKSWGLWLDQWTDGIVDWTFTSDEILSTFKEKKIEIPESFLRDFYNTIERKKRKRY